MSGQRKRKFQSDVKRDFDPKHTWALVAMNAARKIREQANPGRGQDGDSDDDVQVVRRPAAAAEAGGVVQTTMLMFMESDKKQKREEGKQAMQDQHEYLRRY